MQFLSVSVLVNRLLSVGVASVVIGSAAGQAAAQPVNDFPGNALVLPPNTATSGTCVNATNDYTPMCPEDAGGGVDVWYRFQPPSAGPWTFSLCATPNAWDTTLVVIRESDGAEVGCGDGGCTSPDDFLLSRIAPISLLAGASYLVRVAAWDAGTSGEPFVLIVTGTVPPSGRCCSSTGSCMFVAQANCAAPGTWTSGGSCTPNPCVVTGACCNFFTLQCTLTTSTACPSAPQGFLAGSSCGPNPCTTLGSCCGAYNQCRIDRFFSCDNAATRWTINGTCSPSPCGAVIGACCAAATGQCSLLSESACTASVSTSWNGGEACGVSPCAAPMGACCGVGSSCFFDTSANCQSYGIFIGNGTSCSSSPCGTGTGACCVPGGGCSFTLATGCVSPNGFEAGATCNSSGVCVFGACCSTTTSACTTTLYAGCNGSFNFGGSCSPNPCPQPGACCSANQAGCTVVLHSNCNQGSAGLYRGDGTTCSPDPCPGAPNNDLCIAGAALPIGQLVAGSTFRASGSDITSCSDTSIDVWYSFRAPATGSYVVSLESTFGMALAAFAADSCPVPLNSDVACTPAATSARIYISLAAGTPVIIRVGDYPSTPGAFRNFGIRLDPYTIGPAPANDRCSSSSPIVSAGVLVSGDSTDAHTDLSSTHSFCDTQNLYDARPGRDVFYRFIPTCTGAYTLSTCGSSFRTYVEVLTDCSDSPASRLACSSSNTQTCPIQNSNDDHGVIENLSLTAGQVYVVRISGHGNQDHSQMGPYQLLITPSSPCHLGACCDGSICYLTDPAACAGSSQHYAGENIACNLPGNNTTPCSRADFDHSGGPPSVEDIFRFIAAFFDNDRRADINDSGLIGPQDIFDFVAAYFGG